MNNLFYKIGSNVKISSSVDINMTERTAIGNNSIICPNCWLCVHVDYFNKNIDCNIILKEKVYLGRNSIIESFNLIELSSNVIIGPNVYISDNYHAYEDFTKEIGKQGFKDVNNKIIINSGAWIGEGSSILGNITIGYGSVVGAKSLVNEDVPNHCVVTGVPAIIIKICDYRTGEWINVKGNLDLLGDILKNRGNFKGYGYYNTMDKFKLNDKRKIKHVENNVNNDVYRELTDEISNEFKFALKCLKEGKNEEFIDVLKELSQVIDNAKEGIYNKAIDLFSKEIKMNSNMIISFYEKEDFLSMERFFNENFVPVFKNIIIEFEKM